MSDLQVNNERFNNAVNWLKAEGKIKTLYSLADKLEVSRKEFDRFRNGSKKVSIETVEKLLSNFAKCRSFFENESAKKKDILGLLIDTQSFVYGFRFFFSLILEGAPQNVSIRRRRHEEAFH